MSTPSRPALPASSVEPLEPRIAPANVSLTSTGPVSVDEGGTTGLVFTFSRDGSTAQGVSVEFDLSGAAVLDTDYSITGPNVGVFAPNQKHTSKYGRVDFQAGESTKTVTVTPLSDTLVEGDEAVQLTTYPNAQLNYSVDQTASTAGGVITDNDTATVRFTTTSRSTGENNTTVSIGVTLETVGNGVVGAGTLTKDVTVDVVNLPTGTATADVDYTFAQATSVTFSAGDTGSEKLVNLTIIDDSAAESPETVNLGLRAPQAGSSFAAVATSPITIDSATYTETIVDNDTNVTVTNSGPASVAEDGTTNLVFTFTRTGITDSDLTVGYSAGGIIIFGGGASTNDFSVVTGSDVTAFTSAGKYQGNITFHAGETTKSLTLDPTADSRIEGSENLTVSVTAGSTYTITGVTANGTILDNDTATIAFTTAAHSSSENAGTVQVGVTLITSDGAALDHDVTVSVSDLLTGNATAGTDYSFTQQSVTFSAGDTGSTQTVNLTINEDSLEETAETVNLGLTRSGILIPGGPFGMTNGLGIIFPGFNDNVTVIPTPHTETILDNDSHLHLYAFSNSRHGGAIGKGALPIVRIFDASTGEAQQPILAYERSYRDGVRVAVGDVNGDGHDDIITATRSGTGRIRAFDGITHERISFGDVDEIRAFTGKNAHGAYVALGDFYGENSLEIIVGSGLGGGTVKIFSSEDGALQGTKTPFAANYKGGIRVAAGDLNFDGRADIIAGMGQLGSMVKIIASGEAPDVLFQAGPKKLRDGVFVAVGDVGSSGFSEIIVGRGKAGNPGHASIGVFSFSKGDALAATPFGPTEIETIPLDNSVYQYGVRVALADINADGIAEIIAGAGPLGGSKVQFFDGETYAEVTAKATTAFADMPNLGVFVAGHVEQPMRWL